MKWSFPHPYLENLSLHVGSFTQVIGQDQELKYYIWQLLDWYFGGKKYSEEDLTLFQQVEPLIQHGKEAIKRNSYHLISLSDVSDLIEQMTYKKGSVAFDYMKKKFQQVSLVEQIDAINDLLDSIALQLNQELDLGAGDIVYHTESNYLTIEQLLSKSFSPYFNREEGNIAFEFVDNESKLLFLLKMLEDLLKDKTIPVLLLLKNMDDYLTYPSFKKICQYLEHMVQTFPYFQVVLFLSNEGYLYMSKEVFPFINILGDFRIHLYDFKFMYERFISQYPSNQFPTEEEFLVSVQKNASYLLSTQLEQVSLSITDLVTLKIMNKLYHYDKQMRYPIAIPSQLEINFLMESFDDLEISE